MAEDQQFFQQYLRSQAPDGSETVREVVSPSLLDAAGAQQAETAAGRTFVGFVHPDDMPTLGAQPAAPPPPPAAPTPPRFVDPAEVIAAEAPWASRAPGAAPGRTFVSQAPSIVAGTLGGMGGAAVGAMTGPFAPVAVPLFRMAGAGLASGGMEALQAAAEQAPGATSPPSEPGTPLERGERAAARGFVGEAIGLPFRGAQAILAAHTAPVLEAAETLAPVLRQDLPAAVNAVPTAAGDVHNMFYDMTRLLNDPAELAAAKLTPEGQQTLLRAWWQQTAPQGADAVIKSWDTTLGKTGQAALAGPQRDAMGTVVDTLRAGAHPMQWQEWARIAGRSSVLGGLGHLLGYPELGSAAAAIPAAATLAGKAVPQVAAPMLLSPTGSQWLAALPEVGRAAAPWADVGLGAAGQAGTAAVWPPPVGRVPSPY